MLVQSLFTLALIAIVSPWFIVPFLPILVLYYRTQLYYRNCSREIKRLDAIARSPLYSHFGETLTGLSTIRAYAEQERFIAGNESKLDQNNQGMPALLD